MTLSTSQDLQSIILAAEMASYKRVVATLSLRPEGSNITRSQQVIWSDYDHLNIALDKLVMLQMCLETPELTPILMPKILKAKTGDARKDLIMGFSLQHGGIGQAAAKIQDRANLSAADEQTLREQIRTAIEQRLQLAATFPTLFNVRFKPEADAKKKLESVETSPHIRYFEKLRPFFAAIVNDDGVKIDTIKMSVTPIESTRELLLAQQSIQQYRIDHGTGLDDIISGGPRTLN